MTASAATQPEDTITMRFPAVPASGGSARRFVAAALERWGAGRPLVEVATLLTSELVTNAYRHASTAARVVVRRVDHGTTFVVEVQDEGTGQIELRPVGQESESGRGLQIVDALADRWGTDAVPEGSLVWFELHLGRAAP
jgi:anti-sigma regulatory factor (Ser/Thr protein kinase)